MSSATITIASGSCFFLGPNQGDVPLSGLLRVHLKAPRKVNSIRIKLSSILTLHREGGAYIYLGVDPSLLILFQSTSRATLSSRGPSILHAAASWQLATTRLPSLLPCRRPRRHTISLHELLCPSASFLSLLFSLTFFLSRQRIDVSSLVDQKHSD
jgi:hypothetical protein